MSPGDSATGVHSAAERVGGSCGLREGLQEGRPCPDHSHGQPGLSQPMEVTVPVLWSPLRAMGGVPRASWAPAPSRRRPQEPWASREEPPWGRGPGSPPWLLPRQPTGVWFALEGPPRMSLGTSLCLAGLPVTQRQALAHKIRASTGSALQPPPTSWPLQAALYRNNRAWTLPRQDPGCPALPAWGRAALGQGLRRLPGPRFPSRDTEHRLLRR